MPPVKPAPPNPDCSSAWWNHPALAERSIRNTRMTSSQCRSLKHGNRKPHPDPELCSGHTTKTKPRTWYFFALKNTSLFPFPRCFLTGSQGTAGRAHPATGHDDTTPHDSTKDFHSCCPKLTTQALAPGTQHPCSSAVTQHSTPPLRKEFKVPVDNSVLPSRHILHPAAWVAAQAASVAAARRC